MLHCHQQTINSVLHATAHSTQLCISNESISEDWLDSAPMLSADDKKRKCFVTKEQHLMPSRGLNTVSDVADDDRMSWLLDLTAGKCRA